MKNILINIGIGVMGFIISIIYTVVLIIPIGLFQMGWQNNRWDTVWILVLFIIGVVYVFGLFIKKLIK